MRGLKVAVLGPGGVGGFLAAVLSQKGFDVTCIARQSTADWITEHGLKLESKRYGDFIARPNAVAILTETIDLLFITSKAVHLDQALASLCDSNLSETVVVPLLNGLEHVADLRNKLPAVIVPGSIRISSRKVQPGVIVHSSDFAIVNLAGDAVQEKLNIVTDCLNYSDIQTSIAASERHVLWEKLVRLNALACTTAAADTSIGWIRSQPQWRKKLIAIIQEGTMIARAEGVEIDPEREIRLIDTLPESLTSSLRDDIAAHRPSELDAIAGAVVRAGKKHGLPCSATEELMMLINKKIKGE